MSQFGTETSQRVGTPKSLSEPEYQRALLPVSEAQLMIEQGLQ